MKLSATERAYLKESDAAAAKARLERPSGKGKPHQKKTGAELYPGAEEHQPEWDEVLKAAGPILRAKTWEHSSAHLTQEELMPAALDACAKAFLQWRQGNAGPALEAGQLNRLLRSWIATEVEGDVSNEVKILAAKPKDAMAKKRHSLREAEEIEDEGSLSWLDALMNYQEMRKALPTIPDPIDRLLVQAAYAMVHRPEELQSLLGAGSVKFPEELHFPEKDDRWMVEWALIRLFTLPGPWHVCWRQIKPRLRRASAWNELYKTNQGEVSKIPKRRRGARWTGSPGGKDGGRCAPPGPAESGPCGRGGEAWDELGTKVSTSG